MQTFFTTARIIVKHSDLSRPDSTLCVSSHRKKGRNSKRVSVLACLTNLLTVNGREADYGAFSLETPVDEAHAPALVASALLI